MRHTDKPRKPKVSPHSGEGRQLGLDDKHIPSGLNHLNNPPTHEAKPEVPASPPFPDQNAHGVVPEDTQLEKPPGLAKKSHPVKPVPVHDWEEAVPVYQVEGPGKRKVRREISADLITVPAGKPVRIASIDRQRVAVSLRASGTPAGGTASDIMFSESLATVQEGRGALLAQTATSYLRLTHQGELWALQSPLAATPSNQYLSVIIETEVSV